MSTGIDRWMAFSLLGSQDQTACKSWFSGLIGDEDTVLFAEGFEADDGTMPRLRVLFKGADGLFRQALRNNAKRTFTVKVGIPSAAFLKRAKVRGINP